MEMQEIRRRALINAMQVRCGGKQVNLAQQLGARADYVSRMLSAGRNAKGIGGDYAREIESKLGLPPLWLDQLQNAGDRALVPATRANIASVPALEHEHHPVPEDFWGAPLFAADIEGVAGHRQGTLRAALITDTGMSCMSGMRDYVAVVDIQSNTPTDGDIYLISHGNRLKLRRLLLDGDRWIARSDASQERYPDISLDATSAQIVGRLIWGGGFAI